VSVPHAFAGFGFILQPTVIPLSRSLLGAEELAAIARVLDSGRLVQGERVAEFERVVSARVGRTHAVESGRLSDALHTLPQFAVAAREAAAAGRTFPVASLLAERGLSLPLFPDLSELDQNHVIASVRAVISQ
jgi:dTDP-4-amino-4,6-dideoxygalactose transaminase